MKVRTIAFTVLLVLLAVNAQTQQRASGSPAGDTNSETPRFELGVAFGGIHLPNNNNFGLGTRAVFNLNSLFSLEAEGNVFLNNASPAFRSGGRAVQGLFGPKIGFRTDTAGIFFKVRPGFIRFPNAAKDIVFNPASPLDLSIVAGSLTEPVLDLGTVIEFYLSKHWAWRSDFGDTLIFYRSAPVLGVTVQGSTQNTFQFSTGFQYRF